MFKPIDGVFIKVSHKSCNNPISVQALYFNSQAPLLQTEDRSVIFVANYRYFYELCVCFRSYQKALVLAIFVTIFMTFRNWLIWIADLENCWYGVCYGFLMLVFSQFSPVLYIISLPDQKSFSAEP